MTKRGMHIICIPLFLVTPQRVFPSIAPFLCQMVDKCVELPE